MTLRTTTETYATEGEATQVAAAFRRNYRGYDGEAYVYRCNLTGRWVVNASRYLSCD